MSTWLNNPNHPGTRNAIRTSLHRLWLHPLVHADPDVIFFRSIHNGLKPHEKDFLLQLGQIAGFKATSDIPQWLTPYERQLLREFLENEPKVKRLDRYLFRVDGKEVDFEPLLPLPGPAKVPAKLATILGLYDMLAHEILPSVMASHMK
jgi:alpha-galactosidase